MLSSIEWLPPGYFTILQTSAASISFLSSSLMAMSIAWFGNTGLSSPYRRIIFGLSISDIFQSFAFLSGPFAVPRPR